MIVVDTNVVAYFFLPGPFEGAASGLRRGDPDWIVPTIWRHEFRNMLAGQIRCKGLSFDDAVKVQASAEALLKDAEYEVDSASVLRLVCASNCSAYDCEFVCLAKERGIRLVTADRQILSNFPDIAAPLNSVLPL